VSFFIITGIIIQFFNVPHVGRLNHEIEGMELKSQRWAVT